MKTRNPVAVLGLVMASVAIGVGAITLTSLYRTAYEQQRTRLVETVQSWARLIEAVARFDAVYRSDYPGGSMEATLSQVREGHAGFQGFGESGEFVLGRREGDQIVFLLNHRHDVLVPHPPISFSSELAEPMRRALSGESGTVVGLDYRGARVLAAYEPLPEFGLGVVAKIDVSEVRGPFIRSGWFAAVGGLVLIVVGGVFFQRVGLSLLYKLQKSDVRYAEAERVAGIGSWELDLVTKELTWSAEIYRMFDVDPEQFVGTYEAFLETVHPDDRDFVNAAYADSVATHTPYDIVHRLQRKDGGIRYVHQRCETQYDQDGKALRSVGTVQDITERRRVEEELQIRARQQAVIARLGQRALEEVELSTLMDETVELVAETLQLDYCKVLELLPDGSALLLRAGVGWKEGLVGRAIVGAELDSQAGYTLVSDEPVVVVDLRTETRFSGPSLLIEHKVVSGMSVIIGGSDRPYGVMGAHTTRLRTFTQDDINFVQATANMLAEAIQRRRAEEALRLREQQLSLIYDSTGDILYYLRVEPGPHYRFLTVNSAFLKATGLTAEQVVGKTVNEVIPEPSLRLVRSNYEKAIREKRITYWEETSQFPAGSKTGIVSIAPVFDDEGKCTHLVGSVHDITDRKRAEEALRASEQRFRSLFEDVPISLWEEDFSDVLAYLEGLNFREIEDFEEYLGQHPEVTAACAERIRITAVNTAVRELYEAATAEDLLERLARTFTERSYEAFKQQLVAIWRGSMQHELETEVKTLSGALRQVVMSWSVAPDHQETLSRVFVSLSDITERKGAEDEIRALNVSLEHRVAGRTAELEAANKELEAFSYSVSHDLKAPLRAIDGYSGKLEEELGERLNPEGRRLLGVVRQRAQHMGHLIDDLLTFSRLGRGQLRITDVDMGQLAQTTFAELAAAHTGREIEFTVGDLPTVRADLDLIRQVWANLLDNAIKFTGQREVARIEAGYREEADRHVFFVQDNGAGFDMEYVDKLFGVFQRLHYRDEFPGTGVGLANVRRIVERHGGEAWAEGEVDHGATIFFRLPRTERTT